MKLPAEEATSVFILGDIGITLLYLSLTLAGVRHPIENEVDRFGVA